MSLNWPTPTFIGQIYTFNGVSWEWTGESWQSLGSPPQPGPTGPTGPNGPTGPSGPTGSFNAASSAVLGYNQNVTIGTTNTIMPFTESFDLGSEWATNRFTANATGYYCVNTKIETATSREIILTVRKNGSDLFSATETASENGISISGICQLNTGQYLEVFAVVSPSSAPTSNLLEKNYISIFKIG